MPNPEIFHYSWEKESAFGASHIRKIFSRERKRVPEELIGLGQSGRWGLTKEGKELSKKIFTEILGEGQYSPINLDCFRRGGKWFRETARDQTEDLVGRSLSAKANYQIRKIVCLVEAGRRKESFSGSSAEVFRRTKGLSLDLIDYEKLERQYLKLLAREELTQALEKETVRMERGIKAKLAALGVGLAAGWEGLSEKIASSRELVRKALPVALATLALMGLGLGIKECREQRPGEETAREPIKPPTAAPLVDPSRPTLIFKTPPPIQAELASTLPLTGAERRLQNQSPAKASLRPGDHFTLEGSLFKEKTFLFQAVSPSADNVFRKSEAVVCGFELGEEGPTIIIIHSGRVEGQSLPGQYLLERRPEKGEKLLVSTEKGEAKLCFLGEFRVPENEFSAEAEKIKTLASQNGLSLQGKCLFLVTCCGWNSEEYCYQERLISVFSRVNEQVLVDNSYR